MGKDFLSGELVKLPDLQVEIADKKIPIDKR